MSYLTQLKTFVEVYRCKNITKAAANLGLSQPSVTSHIQAMESVVGKSLFELLVVAVLLMALSLLQQLITLQVSRGISLLKVLSLVTRFLLVQY